MVVEYQLLYSYWTYWESVWWFPQVFVDAGRRAGKMRAVWGCGCGRCDGWQVLHVAEIPEDEGMVSPRTAAGPAMHFKGNK